MKKNIFLIIISFCLLTNYLKAQGQTIDQTFRPVISAGLTGSQIDGDNAGGYKHLSYSLGVGINRQISRIIELELALTFLQKGVRSNYRTDSASLNNPNNPFTLIRLNYLEVPLCVKIRYKRFKAEVGGAFAFLVENPPYDRDQNGIVPPNLVGKYQDFDFSALIGCGYKLSPNVWLNLRGEYSMVPVRPYPAASGGVYRGILHGLFNKGFYNNVVMLTLNYILPSKSVASSAPITPNGQ